MNYISPFLLAFNLLSILSLEHMSTELETKQSLMMNNQKQAITEVLLAYQDALNQSKVSEILELYTDDGVFMPSSAPTAAGSQAVEQAYHFVFSEIQLDIKFTIDEIEIAGDYAFARTISKGHTLIHATGERLPEENRELFVLKLDEGKWKIARYMFNKMN